MNRVVMNHATRASGRHRLRRLALLIAAASLTPMFTGCASFSSDGGFAVVERTAKERLGKDVLWSRSEADQDVITQRAGELLAKPLTVDDAVQLALLNNRGLQAAFQELGITEAEVVLAGRLPNPGFSFARLRRGDEVELERGFHFNLARLLALPLLQQVEARRFEQTQAMVTMNMLSLAAEARKAYFNALAGEETVRYMRQVKQAAEASAELARRMEQVGNFNKLQRAREQSFYADAALNLARAEATQRATRERLTRLLGVWGEQTLFRLPDRLPDLPDLPDAATELPDVEAVALAQRLDVQGAKLAAEQTAKNLGLTRTTRFINVLEVGAIHDTSNAAPVRRGWEVSVELPLFDWGGARVARAQAVYMQAVHRAAETAINARSEVREAYFGYRSAFEIARHHRDEIVPLRRRIAEENLLRYNGMLIGVFELLADARESVAAVNAAIEASRDFWLAEADLQAAQNGAAAGLRRASGAAPAMAVAGPKGH